MDGPSVNLKYSGMLSQYHEERKLLKLLDIATCGLHVVHGAFQTDAACLHWNIKIILKCLWQLLHDSSA